MELQAPSHWQTLDFLSDLHLQASERKTFTAWLHYLQHSTADAIFLLGDVFEVWVGDDAAAVPGSFEQQCAQALREVAQKADVFVLHGNRDFLMGKALMELAGATLLPDPSVLNFAGERWLLTHGDALCLADTEYLAFRAQVRSPAWQTAFLAKPLTERLAIARQLREQSALQKRTATDYADVDTAAALQWLQQAHATTMIHGHTHRPDHHMLDATHSRWVLTDWDLDHAPTRSGILRLDRRHAQPYRLDPLTLEPISPG